MLIVEKKLKEFRTDIKKTKYGHSFCSLSCKSQYYGPSKTVSEEQKIKISKGLGIFHENMAAKGKLDNVLFVISHFYRV